MKKILLLVVLAALLTFSSVFAQGIQIIGGDQQNSAVEALDDVKIGTEYQIDGWGILKPVSFNWWDHMYSDRNDDGSDPDSDLASFRINIINISYDKKNYISSNTSVVAVFDNDWKITDCWKGQNGSPNDSDKDAFLTSKDESKWFAISPFYEGSYGFICKLPNYIVESEKPLRMEIVFDDVELTYHIRK